MDTTLSSLEVEQLADATTECCVAGCIQHAVVFEFHSGDRNQAWPMSLPYCGWHRVGGPLYNVTWQEAMQCRLPSNKPGRPHKLRPCPKCGTLIGVRQMRRWRSDCPDHR